MKVLQFVTRLDLGGAQEICLDLCRRLLADGHEVHLLTGVEGELMDDARAIPGLRLHAWADWHHPIRPAADLRCLWRLVALLRRERYDVLHTHSSKAGLCGRVAARLAGLPPRVVHNVQGWAFNRTQPWPVRRAMIALERLAARPGFVLLSCSRSTEQEGRRLGIGREADRRLVLNGIARRPCLRRRSREAIRRRLGLGRRDLLFLQVGNLKPQKDPLTFARAAVEAGRRVHRGRFWIAGAGPLQDDAERIARAGGLDGRFRILGWRRDVPELLAAADVLVLTSRFEGLPMAVLEGMAAGLPVVATAVDGTQEAMEDGRTGYLVPPGEPQAIAGSMVRLARNPALRRRQGRAARRRSASFSAERAVAETLRIYRERR
ncbi:MAG TPA: glycosyltransferase family 4 protein [Candidatus Polarisedimenticolaceae bacterium]|nr:glycosyltransferase family 4 protein [Candidatus Polarisedimenticolaceae bacterium]